MYAGKERILGEEGRKNLGGRESKEST